MGYRRTNLMENTCIKRSQSIFDLCFRVFWFEPMKTVMVRRSKILFLIIFITLFFSGCRSIGGVFGRPEWVFPSRSALESTSESAPASESPISWKTRDLDPGRVRILEAENLRPRIHHAGSTLPFRSGRPVYSGLDQLVQSEFSLLKNRSFAVLANNSSRDGEMRSFLTLLLENDLHPALVFEPEHGLFSDKDEHLKNGIRVDKKTGLKILSLYSATEKKPSASNLEGIDLIVVDIQTLPVRCYTYISTLIYILEAAEENGIEVMILDRPNPYGIWDARGPFPQKNLISFVAQADTPFLYSMTPGEFALFESMERLKKLKLTVVPVSNYRRRILEDIQYAAWVNPSPSIPSIEAALVYTGLVFFEGTNLSLGRGTTRPFVYSGAPWIDSDMVLKKLEALKLPGVQMGTVAFVPDREPYREKTCYGIQFLPYGADFDPIRTSYEYMRILKKMYGGKFLYKNGKTGYFLDRLWGENSFRLFVNNDVPWDIFHSSWKRSGEEFESLIKPYRLYER